MNSINLFTRKPLDPRFPGGPGLPLSVWFVLTTIWSWKMFETDLQTRYWLFVFAKAFHVNKETKRYINIITESVIGTCCN